MRTPSGGGRSVGSWPRRGGPTGAAEPWGEQSCCAGEWEAEESSGGPAERSPRVSRQQRGRGTGQGMAGDLLPSATAKILLPSDVANQFTGVVHFVLSHSKPLIPGLETDLDSVCAGCGSVLLCLGPLQRASAGEGTRAALENLHPAGHTKELSASKSCTQRIFPGQEKCHRVKHNLGDQILLTWGSMHCQLCSWCQWGFFS